MITGRQIREASHMLGWSRADLCLRANLPDDVVGCAELANGEPQASILQQTFERGSIHFGQNDVVMRVERRSPVRDRERFDPRAAERSADARTKAESAFRKATTKPIEGPAPKPAVPGAREPVTLRIDQDVLEHFQADGPGWQDRINAALRTAAGF